MAVQRQQTVPERAHEQVPVQMMAGSRPMNGFAASIDDVRRSVCAIIHLENI
jgi:hypothetical protein